MRIEGLDLGLSGNQAVHFLPTIHGHPHLHDLMQGLNHDPSEWVPGQMGVTGRTFYLTALANGQSVEATARQAVFRTRSGRYIDLHEVAKMLNVSKNKIFILRLLKRSDLIKILHLLPKDKLVNALRLFSKPKLLRLLMLLPKLMLIKMLLHLMSLDYLMKKMPARELFAILRSGKLTNRVLLEGFKRMDPRFLHQIMTKMLGFQDFTQMKHDQMMKIFMDMKKPTILEAMKTLPYKALQPFVMFFVQQDPRLLEHISGEFIFKLFDKMSKPTILQACMVLPDEVLIKFLGQLPDPMLLLAAAQIDDQTFEKYLLSQHPQLLALLGGAAA